MIRSYFRFIVCLCTYIFGSYSHLYPCVVTFFNNSSGPILILDHNNIQNKKNAAAPASLAMVPRGSSRRIGKSDEHAHFTLYTKHPKSNIFISTYDIQQNDCAKNGNPYIKFSDLKNKTGDTALFSVTETSKHHTSMVRQLPSIQRADIYREEGGNENGIGCSMCNQ